MKKIATFKLLGRKWTEALDKEGCEDLSAFGYCDTKRRIIGFHPEMEEEMWAEVRYHEWAHAISDSLGVGLTHEQVQAFGAAMHQVTETYRPLGGAQAPAVDKAEQELEQALAEPEAAPEPQKKQRVSRKRRK